MRTLISCLLITLLSFGLIINEASAKRFGGGRSFGVQRSHNSMFAPHKAQNTTHATKPLNKNRWGSVLGGMLIGGLLTSLFMGHGLASGLLTWLMLGAFIFFIVHFLRRKMQPGFQMNQNHSVNQDNSHFKQPFYAGSSSGQDLVSYPANFSPNDFLRDATIAFNRLQIAYDQKNLQDLQEFTAPEVFAEIKMQLDERGDAFNRTEITNLNAELLDVSKQTNSFIVSVRFTGTINENGEVSPLNEIWHFRQFANSKQWVVGGIQQDDSSLTTH